MPKRVTIKSIADDLGISHMTVSRALSDNPNVQKDTREAVQKRAQELGYVRSAAARAIRGDNSPIVGLLVPNITNDFYARFANTFAEACEDHGLQLIIHLTKDDYAAENEAMLRLREIQAQAVVTVPAPKTDMSLLDAGSGLKNIQLIRQRTDGDPVSSVLVDDSEAIIHAVQHLHALGHRHIAYLGAPEALSSGRQRLAAFQQGLNSVHLSAESAVTLLDAPSQQMGNNSAHRLLQGSDATAIVCGGFEISIGALKALIETNTLNREMAFVGYGDPDFYSWIDGGITTIQVPVDELASSALKIITDETDKSGIEHHSFAAKLVVRNSKQIG
ncbi:MULTISPECIES: LacI family DNA-binding transcriptional regulator [unclassified Ruegeria]|uniref:LacI family DNA-binding transcriptional regulator n=1 Tax=unclassified Ruegeria TaxID=2625375 RepID=UPI001489E908|nr:MULTISPECIES: LacI family DNA-binding transcriptional regulator [unclassified Ruegeria]